MYIPRPLFRGWESADHAVPRRAARADRAVMRPRSKPLCRFGVCSVAWGGTSILALTPVPAPRSPSPRRTPRLLSSVCMGGPVGKCVCVPVCVERCQTSHCACLPCLSSSEEFRVQSKRGEVCHVGRYRATNTRKLSVTSGFLFPPMTDWGLPLFRSSLLPFTHYFLQSS